MQRQRRHHLRRRSSSGRRRCPRPRTPTPLVEAARRRWGGGARGGRAADRSPSPSLPLLGAPALWLSEEEAKWLRTVVALPLIASSSLWRGT
uniref:Uncharacterized protein n=1 Tax=Arundo donax TaxID=35708 RepID=A0A0A9F7J2_ARUDO